MNENPASDVPSEKRPPRLMLGLVVTALIVLTIDQLTKIWAVEALTGRGRVDVVGDLFGLRLIRNPGAAFSMATGATWIFTILATVVVIVIIRIARDLGSRMWALTLGLLVGGATGNLTDRLFREPGFARGHVVDFFQLPHWPIFNVADSSIFCAAILIGWLGLRGVGINGEPVGDKKKDAAAAKDADKAAAKDADEGATDDGDPAAPKDGDPVARNDGDTGGAEKLASDA